MGLVHNHEENIATPLRIFEECRKPAATQTHLWRRQNDAIAFFLQVLLVWEESEYSSLWVCCRISTSLIRS